MAWENYNDIATVFISNILPTSCQEDIGQPQSREYIRDFQCHCHIFNRVDILYIIIIIIVIVFIGHYFRCWKIGG